MAKGNASAAQSSVAAQKNFDLTQLPLQQLQQVRQQMGEELEMLTNGFASLKAAQSRYTTCLSCLKSVTAANKEKTILVPLTNSLYVPGTLEDSENVVVDVGTGYFVERPVDDAQKYFDRKIVYVKGQCDKLQDTVSKRREQLGTLEGIMAMKIEAANKAQAASA